MTFLLAVSLFVFTFSVTSLFAESKPPTWTEHLDIILPAANAAAWAAVKAIGLLLATIGSLCSLCTLLLLFIGKRWMKKRELDQKLILTNQHKIFIMQSQNSKKLDACYRILFSCKGCATTVEETIKHEGDMKTILDSEDLTFYEEEK